VIVLGIDGADGRTVSELMNHGQLPRLAELAASGTFELLGTTHPAESPVAWASLNTGQNPAKTGVPGFVRRELGSRPTPTFGHLLIDQRVALDEIEDRPLWARLDAAMTGALVGALVYVAAFAVLGLALRVRTVVAAALAFVLAACGFVGGAQLRGWLPDEYRKIGNPLAATPFWEEAARAGVPSVILGAAQAFDRPPVEGAKVLAGLGVPDARGGLQSFFVYTTDERYPHRAPPGPLTRTGSGGDKLRVDDEAGRIESAIWGPENFWAVEGTGRPAERIALPLVVDRTGARARVAIGGETQELAAGQWSDWYHLTFPLNPLVKVRAITRAKILSMEDPFELYVDAIQIDPAAPPFWQPISQPHDYAAELEAAIGPYETIGWACMTMPLKDEVVDAVSFMEDIEFTLRWRERMLLERCERDDWRLLMAVESTPDRVQHMMYRYYDPTHPGFDAAEAARTMEFFGETIEMADAIPAIYRQIDRIVGEVAERCLDEGDTLLICSDHGFQSFRRGVHVNNWLAERGYLAVKSGLASGEDFLSFVDWSHTRAYSMGLGMVYLNLRGREPAGIVAPGEAAALLERIRADFVATVDPATGSRIGVDAYEVADLHEGPHLDLEADLMLGFEAGYRVSWETTTGGLAVVEDGLGGFVPGPSIVDSLKNWSGDHVSVDPSRVPGTFFANRKLRVPAGGIDLLHVAPTVLSLLGVAVPSEYDRAPLEPFD
jgi:predicted AlkP superfamily phosphohydrolase/phosphomutase